jgi:DUF4097 and DUF4098 domain-containing protein YvlB
MPSSYTVAIPGHAELHLTNRSGSVTVIAEDRLDVYAEEGASSRGAEPDPTGRVSIRGARAGSAGMLVRCPAGTDLAVGTISGNVELRGPLGEVRITTISGSIAVERAEEIDARTISGHIAVERCSGRCSLRTKSGRAQCGSAHDARVSTISGQIRLDEASGKVRAQTVSGTVAVGTQRHGDVSVQTMSGPVKIEVPPGLRPHARLRSMTGRPRCDCEQGDDLHIAVQSVSGKIEVVPAR